MANTEEQTIGLAQSPVSIPVDPRDDAGGVGQQGLVDPQILIRIRTDDPETLWIRSTLSARESVLARRVTQRESFYLWGIVTPTDDVRTLLAAAPGRDGLARLQYLQALAHLSVKPAGGADAAPPRRGGWFGGLFG